MSSDWVSVKLGEVISVKHGFAFKSEFFCDEPTQHQLITPGNFAVGGGFQLGKGKHYSGPVPREYVLHKGDVVVTMTDLSRGADTLGYAAVIPNTVGTEWLHNQRVGLVEIKPNAPICGEYLHYLLRSRDYRHQVVSSATGSTVKHTAPSRICEFRFQLPPMFEQKAIAAILGALDDRITLLRETNATLEAIAQALFKSWFVDFDPVRAKQAGRAPEGMDETTAALFPDGFEESELGLVPKGWQIGTLADVARQHKATISPLTQPNVLFEHYSLPAFDKGKMPIFEAGSEIKSNKTMIPPNAVLLSKLNPHIPRVWIPANAGAHAVGSTEFLVMVPTDDTTRYFVFCTFATAQFQQALCQLVTGTSNSHQRVKPDGVLAMPLVIPSPSALGRFEEVAAPTFDRIGHNRLQAQTLATLPPVPI